MASRRYLQFLDSSFDDQSDEDDLRWASTPAPMRDGKFAFTYIPRDGSDYSIADRYLMSIEYSPGLKAEILIRHVSGFTSQLMVNIDDVLQGGIDLNFTAGHELLFEIKQTASMSSIRCVGNTDLSAQETTLFTPGWTLGDGELRWGGNVLSDGNSARGHLSLPYAVYPDPFDFPLGVAISGPPEVEETPSGVIAAPVIPAFANVFFPLIGVDVQNIGPSHIASTATVYGPTSSGSSPQGPFPVDDLGSLGQLDYATDGMAVDVGVNPGNVSGYADDIQAAGFKWVRSRLLWSAIEQSAGNYNWTVAPNYNLMVSEFNSRGIGVLFYLRGSNTAVYGSGANEPYDSGGRTAFANFAAAAAAHWSSDKVLFELGNETNIPNFWPIDPGDGIPGVLQAADEYAALANVVIPAMRSASPNVFIVGPGLAGKGGPYEGGLVGAHEYIDRLKSLGTIDALDRPSMHFYTAESESPTANMASGKAPEEADYDVYRSILSYPTGNIFNSEHGWRAGDGNSTEELLQASYNARDFLYGLSRGVRMRVWFLWGGATGQSLFYIKDQDAEVGAGILEQELGGFRFIQRVDTGNSDQYVYEFEDDSNEIRLAAWVRDSGTATSYSHPASDDATVTDVVGNTSTATESGGMINLTLSVHPIYVRLP